MEVSRLPISNSEDCYGPSCVRVPARGLPPALFGEARASLLVPSSAFHLTRRGQAQRAPPSAEAPLPRRLPRLSSRLHWLVVWRTSVCSCTPLAGGQKPPGSTQAREHRGLCLSQPAVRVLWDHRRFHPCVFLAMASMAALSGSRPFEVLPAASRSLPDATPRCIV